jgi:hypothetical protein
VVNNPCITATVDAFSPALTAMTVNQGATVTQEFTDVTDSVGNQYSNKYICGPRTYVMFNNAQSAAITWVSIVKKAGTVGTFTISAFPNDVTYGTTVQTYALFIKMTFDDNPTHEPVYTAINV